MHAGIYSEYIAAARDTPKGARDAPVAVDAKKPASAVAPCLKSDRAVLRRSSCSLIRFLIFRVLYNYYKV
jgi:hypothetical protein